MEESLSPKCKGWPITGLKKVASVFFAMLNDSPGAEEFFTLSFSHFSISRSTRTGNSSLIPDWEILFSAFASPFD